MILPPAPHVPLATRVALAGLSLALLAADARSPTDYASDARAIEAIVNADYAYLDRFPDARMPMTDTLRREAQGVADAKQLIRYSERALSLLADHHAITGASLKDSWSVFPSYGDLWIERRANGYRITAVRDQSPAALAGVRAGDILLAIDGQPICVAIAAYWNDLGTTGGGERDGFAARVLAAGRRDRPRRVTIGPTQSPRELILSSLYGVPRPDRPPLTVTTVGRERVIRFADSLGDDSTIAAFDRAMAGATPSQTVILDLTDTPSGGNTVIARGILGWFVDKPTGYQVHNLPTEQRLTGIGRQWEEQVLPRRGKRHRGPVTVRVGRWTGSMGEGLAIGFHALGTRVEGDRMAGLLGAITDHRLERSGQVIKFPTERLYAVDGTPREAFVPVKAARAR